MKSKRNIKSRKGRKGRRRTRKIGGTALFKGVRNGIMGAVNRVKKRVMGNKVVEVNGQEIEVTGEVTNGRFPENVNTITSDGKNQIIRYKNGSFKYIYHDKAGGIKKIEIVNKENIIEKVIIINNNYTMRTEYVPNENEIIKIDPNTHKTDINEDMTKYKIEEIRTQINDTQDKVEKYLWDGTTKSNTTKHMVFDSNSI